MSNLNKYKITVNYVISTGTELVIESENITAALDSVIAILTELNGNKQLPGKFTLNKIETYKEIEKENAIPNSISS